MVEARPASRASSWRSGARPHLVLMDLQLPGIDGTEALRLLRASSAHRASPRRGGDRFAMEDDRVRALRAGFDGYLEKPISVRTLPEQVRGFLARGSRRDDRRRDRPRGRRPAAERPTAHGGAEPARLPRADGRLRRRRRCEVLAASETRSRAARHRDARHGRLPGLPTDPRGPGDGVPAGRHDHRQRRPGEAARDRGRRGRLRDQAVRAGRAAGAGALAGHGSAATRTRSSGRPPSSPRGTARSRTGSGRRSRSCSGSAGCAGSCRPSSPIS